MHLLACNVQEILVCLEENTEIRDVGDPRDISGLSSCYISNI